MLIFPITAPKPYRGKVLVNIKQIREQEMTYEQLYRKLQKDYTVAAQQYYKLPTDNQASRNWNKALYNLLAYLSRFRGKKISKSDEVSGQ